MYITVIECRAYRHYSLHLYISSTSLCLRIMWCTFHVNSLSYLLVQTSEKTFANIATVLSICIKYRCKSGKEKVGMKDRHKLKKDIRNNT